MGRSASHYFGQCAAIGGVAGLLAFTPAAIAADVRIVHGALAVSAIEAERNLIDIGVEGLDWVIEDARAPITVGPGCLAETPHLARCNGMVFRVWVNAGPGDDLVAVWDTPAPVEIRGGSGNDGLDGAEGVDHLDGGPGRDVVAGGAGDDRLEGGSGDDLMHGAGGDDVLQSDEGDDVLAGGAGDDVLLGGEGRDLLEGQGGEDSLDGQEGADALIVPGSADDYPEGTDDAVYAYRADRDPADARPCPREGSRCRAPSKPGTKGAPARWPPSKAEQRASASRASASTRAYLRTRRNPRGVTVHVRTLGTYTSRVTLTWLPRRGPSLGKIRRRVETGGPILLRVRPPSGTYRVRARCVCER